MLPPDQRRWCLEQAIEITKLAPADSLATHERLKRVYKRLIALSEDTLSTHLPGKSGKNAKAKRL
jgi:hypothetical protein